MNKEEFIIEAKKLGIDISPEKIIKLEKYLEILMDYNEHTNLTAIRTIDGVYLNHFFDSLTIVKNIDLTKDLKLLDIGSGAGFPGLVLKIVFPNLEVTLLDSNNKKTKFLEKVVKELELEKIHIINSRSEDYIQNYRGYYDVVTARAVAHLRILLELSMPFLKDNGVFIAMKGNVSEELKESEETMVVLNTEIEKKSSFTLPITNSVRNIINFKKIGTIKDIYPRSYSQIIKKPLKKSSK